jgi:hypothetical protein
MTRRRSLISHIFTNKVSNAHNAGCQRTDGASPDPPRKTSRPTSPAACPQHGLMRTGADWLGGSRCTSQTLASTSNSSTHPSSSHQVCPHCEQIFHQLPFRSTTWQSSALGNSVATSGERPGQSSWWQPRCERKREPGPSAHRQLRRRRIRCFPSSDPAAPR